MWEHIFEHHNVAHVVANWPVPLAVSADVWFPTYTVASLPPHNRGAPTQGGRTPANYLEHPFTMRAHSPHVWLLHCIDG